MGRPPPVEPAGRRGRRPDAVDRAAADGDPADPAERPGRGRRTGLERALAGSGVDRAVGPASGRPSGRGRASAGRARSVSRVPWVTPASRSDAAGIEHAAAVGGQHRVAAVGRAAVVAAEVGDRVETGTLSSRQTSPRRAAPTTVTRTSVLIGVTSWWRLRRSCARW